jgi:hypothetical protein
MAPAGPGMTTFSTLGDGETTLLLARAGRDLRANDQRL